MLVYVHMCHPQFSEDAESYDPVLVVIEFEPWNRRTRLASAALEEHHRWRIRAWIDSLAQGIGIIS